MRKNLDDQPAPAGPAALPGTVQGAEPEQGLRMRQHLSDFLVRLASGALPLRLPVALSGGVTRGEGHFHLAPELFLQVSGWTRFRFPQGELRLDAGEALVLPPKLMHAEIVGAGAEDEPFRNVVIYAEGDTLTCHLAQEATPGRPDILHLEAVRAAQAPRLHGWLADAARLGRSADTRPETQPLAELQARALVSAATAGVLRTLEEQGGETQPEPLLVARVRVLIQNRLGDHTLSVRQLAAQCGCTADYLSHVFSQTTGEHLVAYINRQRMERAAHLLSESAMAGKEVAWASGFATQSYFIRTFRTHFGMTPKAWRAGHGEAD